MNKKIAVLNIISRCNLRCPFCFGPPEVLLTFAGTPRRRDLSTVQAKDLILELKKSGTKILIFSGGEPLLRRDIFELICFAKKLGFYTVLHTNGILLCSKFKAQNSKLKTTTQKLKLRCLKYLDQINLPLDGYNAKTNDAMRGKGHFRKVMSALRLLKDAKIRVIISTVATAKNKNSVPKIGAILPRFIYKWRIFQFNPQGKARRARKEFALSQKEFAKIKKEISRLSAGLRLPFRVQCVSLRDRKFWKSYEII